MTEMRFGGQVRVKIGSKCPKIGCFLRYFQCQIYEPKSNFLLFFEVYHVNEHSQGHRNIFFLKNSLWVECSNTVKNGFLHICQCMSKMRIFSIFQSKMSKNTVWCSFSSSFHCNDCLNMLTRWFVTSRSFVWGEFGSEIDTYMRNMHCMQMSKIELFASFQSQMSKNTMWCSFSSSFHCKHCLNMLMRWFVTFGRSA